MADIETYTEAVAPVIIECKEGLDISLATDFKALIEQSIKLKLPIVLDASELNKIDAAGLQLLTSFFSEADTSGFDVCWKDPSEKLQQAAQLSGLSEALHL